TGILVGELAALYGAFAAGRPSPLPDLALQYGDFAVWQRGWMAGEVLEAELAYWRGGVGGGPPAPPPPPGPRAPPPPPGAAGRGDRRRGSGGRCSTSSGGSAAAPA